MSELDDYFPREKGISALDVMIQARRGEFASFAHYKLARDNGIAPKKFTVKGIPAHLSKPARVQSRRRF